MLDVSNSDRPLSDFMTGLVDDDQLLRRFWDNPYLAAKESGVPWYACILLGQGDLDKIRALVDVELMRDQAARDNYYGSGGGGGGPIGVKTG